jgi:hypothetical protein
MAGKELMTVEKAIAHLQREHKHIKPEGWEALRTLFPGGLDADAAAVVALPAASPASVSTGFDLLPEVQAQLELLRDLRLRLVKQDSGGGDFDMKSYTSLITASTSLFSLLTRLADALKTHRDVKNLENAVFETVRVLDSERREFFLAELERQFEIHTPG